MNRVFHSKITWYNYFYLLVLSGTTIALLWEKQIIIGVILMLLLIVLIERIIHTTYTVTANGELILSYGRFTKQKTVLVSKITQIERIKTLKAGKFYLTKYLFIIYNGGFIAVTPVKEDEMIEYLVKKNPEIIYEPI